MYTPINPSFFFYIKLGCKGVYITRTCFHDGMVTLTFVFANRDSYSISVQESQPPGRHPTDLPRRHHTHSIPPFHVYPGVQEGYLVLKLAPTVVVYNPINDILLTADGQRCGPTFLIAGNVIKNMYY